MDNNLEKLRAALESLQEFQLPDKYVTSSSRPSPTSAAAECPTSADDSRHENETVIVDGIDPALLQRYHQARDRYLTYRLKQSFFDKLVHDDDDDDDDDEEASKLRRQQEEAAIRERLDELRSQVQQRFHEVHVQRSQLESDYNDFCDRRERFQELIHVLEQANGDEIADEDMDDSEIDEDALLLEEERIKNLTRQKEELQAQLKSLREETVQMEVEAAQTEMELNDLLRQRGVDVDNTASKDVRDETIAAIEAENRELQQKLQQAKEVTSWNEDMCAAFEHFGGVKIVSVVNDDQDNVLLTIELLQDSNFTMQVTLQPKPENKKILEVAHAKFLPNKDNDHANNITLPNLDLLVAYARTIKMTQIKEDLRFVVREAMMQIRVSRARATALAFLFAEFPQVVVPPESELHQSMATMDEQCTDDPWQVVKCQIYENVIATLRLSPDCPLVKGSVYLDDLSGLTERGKDVVETIKQTVNAKKFKSPVALMSAVRTELAKSSNVALTDTES